MQSSWMLLSKFKFINRIKIVFLKELNRLKKNNFKKDLKIKRKHFLYKKIQSHYKLLLNKNKINLYLIKNKDNMNKRKNQKKMNNKFSLKFDYKKMIS